MPAAGRGRRCIPCGETFITRSPTRWWCDNCKPEPLRPRPKKEKTNG